MPAKRAVSNDSLEEERPTSKRGKVGEDKDEEDLAVTDVPSELESRENGIIEKISMKNFMCHDRLDINFYPNANFVIGRNGSGKSAILTALVVGLGGKASATNRGSSLKSFIKNGKQVAEVTVHLKNNGQDAYKAADYGRRIIIERKFSQDGSSSYKIKDSNGKTVSSKREELNNILDVFNIQVSNPVCVLNQDTSKNFLFSKNPKDKYKFFLSATQLENVRGDYVSANESLQKATDILTQRETSLPILEREVGQCHQKFEALQQRNKLHTKVTELKNQVAWSFVAEKEREYNEAEKRLKVLESSTHKYSEKVQRAKQSIENLKKKQKEVQQQLFSLVDESKQLEPQQTSAKRNYDDKKKAHRNAVMEERNVDRDIISNKKDVTAIKGRIAEIQSSTQNQNEKIARDHRISELETMILSLDANKRTIENDREQFLFAITKLKEEQYKLRTEDHDYTRTINSKKQEMRGKIASKTDKMRKYGDYMPKVMQQIEDAHRSGQFHEKPKGPVGALLNLKEPEWALAVECCLKGLMTSFCCHDHHDERVLEKIFRNCCPANKKPSTITSKFSTKVHDVSRGKARSAYPTVLDMLQVDDPTIKNCLIDQRGIESVILIKDAQEGRNVMANAPPKNTREAFLMSGDQMHGLPTFRYYSATQEKANVLTVNVDEDIRMLDEEIKSLEGQQQQLRHKQQENVKVIGSNQSKERQCQTRLNKLFDERGQLEFEVSELKNKEDPAPIDVTTLEDEVDRYNATIQDLEEKRKPLHENSSKCKAELEEAEKNYSQLQTRLRVIAESVDPFKEEMTKIETEISNAKDFHLHHYISKEKEHLAKVQEAKQNVEDLKKSLEEDTGKAEQICAKIHVRRTPESILTEIRQIEKQIRTEEKERGNPEEITRKYYETLNSYKNIKTEMAHQEKFLQKFKEVMVRRQQQYYRLRQWMALRSKYAFIVMLGNRNYDGKIVFNHKDETLEMNVQPNLVNGEAVKDMKSLSGGERSFATVCFILALWEAVESPFRCLDEFDVFMDMVNRRMAMEMMLSVTRTKRDVQFIFLSPLNMSYIVDKSCNIFRMPTPERGQSTLNFAESQPQQEDNEENEAGPAKRKR